MSPDDRPLVDIAVRCRAILELVSQMDFVQFGKDPTSQAAVQYYLSIIGEATKRLSTEFRAAHSGVEWSEIAGLRDVIIHAYHRVSVRRIWEIATGDVPDLLAYVEPLLPEEPRE